MKIIELRLRNFKKFISTDISLNRPLTVLVGRNNSGKTSILQAISLALDIPIPHVGTFLNKKIGNTGTAQIIVVCRFSAEDWINAIKLIQHEKTVTGIDVNQLAEKIPDIEIIIERNISYVDGRQTQNAKITRLENNESIKTLLDLEREVVSLAVSRLTNQNLSVFFGMMVLPIERQLTNTEKFVPYNQLSNSGDYQKFIRNILYHLKRKRLEKYKVLVERITGVFDDIDKIDTIHDEDTGQVNFTLEQENTHADIAEMGSGIQALVLILAQILSPNRQLALLDEPDISMHPGLVRQLVEFLNEISKDVQIIISSHNETFVNILDSSNILHVKGISSLESNVTELDKPNQDIVIYEDIGVLRGNFDRAEAETSEVIVFVEGPTDWEYIKKLATSAGVFKKIQSIKIKDFPLYGKNRKIDSEMLDEINQTRTPFLLVRDRDETTTSQIAMYNEKLGEDRVHFLKLREIENYVLSSKSILKLLKEKGESKPEEIKSKINQLTETDIEEKVWDLANTLKRKVLLLRFINSLPFVLLTFPELGSFVEKNRDNEIDRIVESFSTNVFEKISALTPEKTKKFLEEEDQKLSKEWTKENFIKICPGKDLLKEINKWCTKEFGINVTIDDLIDRLDVVDSDISQLVDKISKLKK